MMITVFVFVDDTAIAVSTADVQKAKSELMKQFDMTDLGEMKRFLGMEIERDRTNKTITTNQ
jgi:hypothetical protein